MINPRLSPEEIRALDFNAVTDEAQRMLQYRMTQECAAQVAELNRKFELMFPETHPEVEPDGVRLVEIASIPLKRSN